MNGCDWKGAVCDRGDDGASSGVSEWQAATVREQGEGAEQSRCPAGLQESLSFHHVRQQVHVVL